MVWRAWLRGIDLPIYVVGVMPPLVGAAATLATPSPLPWTHWAWATGAFLLLHAAVNVYNDAFDAATMADRFKRHSLARLASVGNLHAVATLLLATGCAIGIALWLRVGGWTIPLLSACGVFLVFAYHAPPLRLSHRGWGEAVTFLGFGVIPVWTVAALASGGLSRQAIWPGIWVGLAAALILYHHNVASCVQDAQAGKRTLATRLGNRGSRTAARAGAAILCVGVAIWTGSWAWALATLAALGALAVAADVALARSNHFARAASLAFFVATSGSVLLKLVSHEA